MYAKDIVEHWNTAAVSAMLQGDWDAGMQKLRTALLTLRRIQSQRDDVPSMEDERELQENHKRPIESVLIPNGNFSSTNAVFPFYNRALLPELGDGNDQDGVLERTTAVVLYNSGFCYHLRGLQSGTSVDLQKALDYYQLAATVLFRGENDISNVLFGDKERLLLLALINNMGFIYEAFKRYQEAAACLDWMVSCIGSVNDDSFGTATTEAFQSAIMSFSVTAFLFPKWNTHPAAAA